MRAVEIARSWIGTPYRHQASCRGAGADCLGLVRGVWRELYGPEPVALPPYTRDWNEASGDEALWRGAQALLLPLPKAAPAPGDVLLFRMASRGVAKHLAIAAAGPDGPTMIHAYSGHGVIENAFSRPWARRMVARFRFP